MDGRDGDQPTPDQRRFRQIFDQTHNHAQTLVQAFKDSGITGGTPGTRLGSVLELAGGSPNAPSVPFNESITSIGNSGVEGNQGVGDTGFRRELRDSIQYQKTASGGDTPMHRPSSNQIGHFLSAASFGFSLTSRDIYIKQRYEADAKYQKEHPIKSLITQLLTDNVTVKMDVQFQMEKTQYHRAMIGHELIADRSVSNKGIISTIASPFVADDKDVDNFFKGRLDLIKIDDTKRGNSYQDLLLTWVGYKFGEKVAQGKFKSNADASRWLGLMLTGSENDAELNEIKSTDEFYSDAQQMKQMLNQFREIQKKTHPQIDPTKASGGK